MIEKVINKLILTIFDFPFALFFIQFGASLKFIQKNEVLSISTKSYLYMCLIAFDVASVVKAELIVQDWLVQGIDLDRHSSSLLSKILHWWGCTVVEKWNFCMGVALHLLVQFLMELLLLLLNLTPQKVSFLAIEMFDTGFYSFLGCGSLVRVSFFFASAILPYILNGSSSSCNETEDSTIHLIRNDWGTSTLLLNIVVCPIFMTCILWLLQWLVTKTLCLNIYLNYDALLKNSMTGRPPESFFKWTSDQYPIPLQQMLRDVFVPYYCQATTNHQREWNAYEIMILCETSKKFVETLNKEGRLLTNENSLTYYCYNFRGSTAIQSYDSSLQNLKALIIMHHLLHPMDFDIIFQRLLHDAITMTTTTNPLLVPFSDKCRRLSFLLQQRMDRKGHTLLHLMTMFNHCTIKVTDGTICPTLSFPHMRTPHNNETTPVNISWLQVFMNYITSKGRMKQSNIRHLWLIPNNDGVLPLHILLKQRTWMNQNNDNTRFCPLKQVKCFQTAMLQDVTRAIHYAPESVVIPDPSEGGGIYPFMLVALGNDPCLSTTFELLRLFVVKQDINFKRSALCN